MPDPDATSRLHAASDRETVEEPLSPIGHPHRWIPYLEAAALAFLGLLALGAVLLVAVKLQYSGLGAGADPVEVLTSVIILSLAVLRVPVHVGELTFTVLPLGALAAVALIVRWACRSTLHNTTLLRVLWVGPIFGVVALVAALAFRHRFDPDAVYAGAPSAFFFGALWTGLFAAWFFVTRGERSSALLRRTMTRLQQRSRSVWEATIAAAIMLAGTLVLGTAAGLVWMIVALVRGAGPQQLDLTGLLAATVWVAAFAPNLAIAAAALSLGAPLEVGAGLTVRGRVRGTLQELSIVAGEGTSPAILMVAVPLLACAAAGYWVGHNTEASRKPLSILVASSGVFALMLTLLSWLGHARLGAELAADRGFGLVAPDAAAVFVMASVWGFTGSLLGWTIASTRRVTK